MSEDINNLQSRIQELEEALEDKDIMINLLLKEVKRSRGSSSDNLPKRFKREVSDNNVSNINNVSNDTVSNINNVSNDTLKDINNINIVKENSTINNNINTSNINNNNIPPKTVDSVNWFYKYKLRDDLEALLSKKKVPKVFKDNLFFDEFVEYCSDIYLVPSFDETVKILHSKNVKKYLLENKSRILKYLILNINKLPFGSLCSTFLALSSEFKDDEKLVILHDIILYITDYSKMLYYIFCIINTQNFFIKDEDIFKSTLCSILSFQVLVDLEIHKNKKIVVHTLTMIRNILNLKKPTRSLEDTLLNIKIDLPCFTKNKFNTDLYRTLYSVRSLSHFLDWDYVYNTFIIEHLTKEEENSDKLNLLIMGILGLNSLRIFGTTESTETIFQYLKGNMKGTGERALVSYLILKQVDEKYTMKYLEEEGDKLKREGYDIEYLRKLLIY